jgi:hypothetical protein
MDELCHKSECLLANAQQALASLPEDFDLDDVPVDEFEIKELECPVAESHMLLDPFFSLANLAQDAAEHMFGDELHEMYLITSGHILKCWYMDDLDFEPQFESDFVDDEQEEPSESVEEGMDGSTLVESFPVQVPKDADIPTTSISPLSNETLEPNPFTGDTETIGDPTYSTQPNIPRFTILWESTGRM